MQLEIACFNLQSCMIAQQSGAHRIELCENYQAGGLSPSIDLIQRTRRKIKIELFVMIRPREGNFVYSEDEFIQMQKSILLAKENNCDGFVFGILTHSHEVNTDHCKKLVELAKPLPCTFHRAFDECNDIEKSLEIIIDCGFKRVLTSGMNKTALQGTNQIKQLINQAKNRIVIMPGGNIRSENINEISKLTGANEFHSSAIKNNSEIADETEIKSILQILKTH